MSNLHHPMTTTTSAYVAPGCLKAASMVMINHALGRRIGLTRCLSLLWFGLVLVAFGQTFPVVADPYRTWAIAQWGAAVVNDASQETTVWGMDANPDADDFTNLQEYAFGTNPRQYSGNPVVTDVGQTLGSYMAMTFPQRTDDPALIVVPQYSRDLRTWWPNLPPDSFSYSGAANLAFSNGAQGPASSGLRVTTQVCTVPLDKAGSLFTRLVVMRDRLQAIGTPLDSVHFADSVAGSSNSAVDSNSVALTGFSGSVGVSVTGGAHLIVNGVDVGASATVASGSTLRLSARSPSGTVSNPTVATYAFNLGSYTATWKVATQPFNALSAIPDQTVSGYTAVSAGAEGGAASVNIPITTPQGTGRIVPQLALSYSSQGGNGLVGVGFGISGLPSVTRTGSVPYLDQQKSGVSFGPRDRFDLNGQLLLLVSGVSGGDGAEYRTEPESFSQVISHGVTNAGPLSWTMKTKAGLTYEFGASADSRIMANRSVGDTAVLSWVLTRITDNVGNSMKFTYALEGAESGHARIVSITFTENTAAGLTAGAEVAFSYEDRPDVRTSYVAGARVALLKRLNAIECRQGGKVARRYELTYQQAAYSGNSQLTQILERGKKPDNAGDPWPSFAPTVFTWQQNPAAGKMTQVNSTQLPVLAQMGFSKSPPSFTIQGDFNGDGIMDLMQLDDHGGPSFWLALGRRDGGFDYKKGIADFTAAHAVFQSSGNLRTGDFNGDGKTDLLYISSNAASNWLALSRGDGTFEVKTGAALGALQAFSLQVGYTQALALDVNGDGRTDLVVVYPSDSRNLPNRVFLAGGAAQFLEVSPGAAFQAVKVSDTRSTYSWVLPGDFNGDGLPDILHLYYNGQGSWLALSNGDGTFTMRDASQLGGLANQAFARSWSYWVTGDFNGDGLTDVANFDDHGVVMLSLCRGDGTFEPIVHPAVVSNRPVSGSQYTHFYTGDLNGDGFTDIYQTFNAHAELCWLAYGAGERNFNCYVGADMGALDGATFTDPEHNPETRTFVGDFDGDGHDDVVNLNYNGNSFYTRSLGFDAPRIVQVTNGHGGYTKFNYKPLTDPSVYKKGNTAAYPYCDVTGPMYMVSSVVSRNGADGDPYTPQANPTPGETTVSYFYEGARSLLDGHGFQGFAATQATNQPTGITSRTEYVTSDPNLAGRPSREVHQLADGRLISESLTTWTSNPITLPSGFQTHFPYATQTISREYEINNGLGSAPIKTTVVSGTACDSYGNLTDSTTDYGGGFTEVTHSVYTNDTGHWWLGRLSDTTVTQTSPGPVSVTRHSTFEYSPTNGQLTKETVVTPESNLRLEKSYQHDGFGNITQSTLKDLGTGETRSTNTTYSPDGRFIVQTKNSLGQVESKNYDPLNGTVLTQTGPNGLTTAWIYDAFGRPLREIRPDGTETLMQYMRANPGGGFPARVVHAVLSSSSGQTWKYTFYDVLDREIGSMTPHFSGQLQLTQKIYNNLGQLATASLPFLLGGSPLYTTSQFDPIGRVIQQIAPGNRVTSTSYSGLTATVTNPKNETFTSTSDLRGRTTSSTSFGSDTVTNTHDPYGNLLKVDDGHGRVTTMSYDGRGQKMSMTEPNSGTILYKYNAFGEIISQTDALSRTTAFTYDALGRLVRRFELDGNVSVETDWEYDTAPYGAGKLARVSRQSDGYQESYRYDAVCRLAETLTQVGSMKFLSSTSFDQYGRPLALTYPTGFAIKNEYNGDGYPLRVRDAASGFVYWTAVSYNEHGQLVEELLGNGLTTRRTFDDNTGLLQGIKTGSGTGLNVTPTVQNLAYQFDNIGTLTQRSDLLRGITENFSYDQRNQLAGISGTGVDPVTVVCDQFGNIASRSDVGVYSYGGNGAGPHAVTRIANAQGTTLRTLTYNAVGNCTQDGDTTLAYNSSNQPVEVRNSSATLLFSYTPAHTRYRLIQQIGAAQTERLYIGGLYERESAGGRVVHTHYIPAGGGIVAINTQSQVLDGSSNTVTSSKTRYLHKDHLGSLQAITREDGGVEEVLDFDAWGRRRTFDSGTHRFSYASVSSQTDRGFTGHEMLDPVGLIHMNGRIYDPTLGRFLSVDPLVQKPRSLQSYDRYSYVVNNPLSLTDPSGFVSVDDWGYYSHASYAQLYHRSPSQQNSDPRNPNATIRYTPGLKDNMFRGVQDSTRLTEFTAWNTQFQRTSSFPPAFTGTPAAGGSLGDAQKAGVKAVADHPLDISENDLTITLGIGLVYPAAVVVRTIAGVLSFLGISDFGERMMQTEGKSLTLTGTGDKTELGVLIGNNSKYDENGKLNPGSIPGALGIATGWVYQLGFFGDRDKYEAGGAVHDRWTLFGEQSDNIRSFIETGGEGLGVALKHLGLGEFTRGVIGESTHRPDFFQGMYNGATKNLDSYSIDGHN